MTSKTPPSKTEATVDALMHRIELQAEELRKKAKNGGSKRLRRRLTIKRTKMAMTAFNLEDSTDG